MQEMPLFVCATRRGWTVASENGRAERTLRHRRASSFIRRARHRQVASARAACLDCHGTAGDRRTRPAAAAAEGAFVGDAGGRIVWLFRLVRCAKLRA